MFYTHLSFELGHSKIDLDVGGGKTSRVKVVVVAREELKTRLRSPAELAGDAEGRFRNPLVTLGSVRQQDDVQTEIGFRGT